MALINLSEVYRRSHELNFLERFKYIFRQDIYYASSLGAIKDGFESKPPRKDSALVVINGIEIKAVEPFYDEQVSLDGMDEGHCSPLFYIRDFSEERLARWIGGNSQKYMEKHNMFGFNTEDFVVIPETILEYGKIKGENFLLIKYLSDTHPKDTKKRKTLEEKIREFLVDSRVKVSPLPA